MMLCISQGAGKARQVHAIDNDMEESTLLCGAPIGPNAAVLFDGDGRVEWGDLPSYDEYEHACTRCVELAL